MQHFEGNVDDLANFDSSNISGYHGLLLVKLSQIHVSNMSHFVLFQLSVVSGNKHLDGWCIYFRWGGCRKTITLLEFRKMLSMFTIQKIFFLDFSLVDKKPIKVESVSPFRTSVGHLPIHFSHSLFQSSMEEISSSNQGKIKLRLELCSQSAIHLFHDFFLYITTGQSASSKFRAKKN